MSLARQGMKSLDTKHPQIQEHETWNNPKHDTQTLNENAGGEEIPRFQVSGLEV